MEWAQDFLRSSICLSIYLSIIYLSTYFLGPHLQQKKKKKKEGQLERNWCDSYENWKLAWTREQQESVQKWEDLGCILKAETTVSPKELDPGYKKGWSQCLWPEQLCEWGDYKYVWFLSAMENMNPLLYLGNPHFKWLFVEGRDSSQREAIKSDANWTSLLYRYDTGM